MAIALSNHSLSSPLRLSLIQKPCNTLQFKNLPIIQALQQHTLCKSHPGFPISSLSPIAKPSFKCCIRIKDSESNTIDGEDTNFSENNLEDEGDQKPLSSLKNLVKVYKKAVFDGDEKTVSDIEAMIYIMENDKNELVQKVASLSADITSGKGKYLRLQADFENFRKRTEKEHLTSKSDAQGDVIKSLLPLVDNFERAKQQISPETEKEKKIDTSYQGIYKQFVEIMRSLRVAIVPTVGKPFDPLLHEAIAREESEEFKEGVVIQESRRGFLLGNRLLRPAMVKVSSGPGRHKKVPASSTDFTNQSTATAGLEDGSMSHR